MKFVDDFTACFKGETQRGIFVFYGFDKKGDFLMYVSNSVIYVKPVNIYFMCQSLGSDYCSEAKLN